MITKLMLWKEFPMCLLRCIDVSLYVWFCVYRCVVSVFIHVCLYPHIWSLCIYIFEFVCIYICVWLYIDFLCYEILCVYKYVCVCVWCSMCINLYMCEFALACVSLCSVIVLVGWVCIYVSLEISCELVHVCKFYSKRDPSRLGCED